MSDFPFPLTALVTLLALGVYHWTFNMVGIARTRLKVPAPSTDGHPDFARYYRVQMNTVEQLVIFVPALWLFALTVSDMWAAIIGAVWPMGRVVYALSYYKAAEKRGLGFVIGFLSTVALLIGAAVGVVMQMI